MLENFKEKSVFSAKYFWDQAVTWCKFALITHSLANQLVVKFDCSKLIRLFNFHILNDHYLSYIILICNTCSS